MRVDSHVRFKAPQVRRDTPMPGLRAPSTLPPPPFQHEADAAGIEWWLESHLSLAGNLLCLEQALDSAPRVAGIHAVLHLLNELRDALYEVYCDAADARMNQYTREGAAFAKYIRGLYAWAEGMVEAHLTLASRLRSTRIPSIDLSSIEETSTRLAPCLDDEAARDIAHLHETLGVDVANPIEPLRNLRRDIDALFTTASALKARLVSSRS
jgi:hypothetical protein